MGKVRRKAPQAGEMSSSSATSSSTGDLSRHTCPVCEDIIRETKGRSKGQDAVFCDGSCQMWLHRCCAGLSRERFEVLASSEESFLCPACQRDSQQETITLLKDELAALRAELHQLKESVVALQASQSTSKETNLRWNVVADRGTKRPPRKRTVPDHESRDTCKTDAAQRKQPSSQRQRKRVAIPGARRIWGTMRSTTQTAVTNALKQLTTVDVSRLIVKRKFKTAVNNPTRVQKWWFIIRGEEDLLQQMEEAWNAVSVQTTWKLEPAYMYSDNETTVEQSDQNEEATGIVQHNDGESQADNDGESTAPVNDTYLSHNASESFLDRQ